MKSNVTPQVSIIVPCFNENQYIGPFLDNLIDQLNHHDALGVEVLIADGMSNDGTRRIIEQIAATDFRIRLIDNPGRIVSTGLNLAIKEAMSDIIIRMDVHSIYADDYVQKCVDTLNNTGANKVGGSIRPRGVGDVQEAIAIASNSSFSMGGARFHDEDYEGLVDTVYLGCWRKKTLEDIGMFDEELVRNQDDELNLRITLSGGKIWQSKEIRSWYYPRPSLRSLFSQLRQYGYWKVRVIQKHKMPASFRSLVPGLFLGALLILLALSAINHVFAWGFLLLAGLYAVATLIASIIACKRISRIKFLPIMPLIFVTFHFGYGYGFLRGIIDFGLRGSKGHISFSNPKRG